MKKIEKSIELGGRKLTLQTGIVAPQASGAILAQYGDTVVLATVVSSPLREDLGYFPLTVEYQERLYAGGRIKGSRWVKREGRPSDEEILSARLIDRSIRPLFPETYKKDVQVMITVLSVDIEDDPSVLSAIAVLGAIEHGQKDAKKVIELIEDLAKEVKVEKESAGEALFTAETKTKVKKLLEGKAEDLIKVMAEREGGGGLERIKTAIAQELSEESPAAVSLIVEKIVKEKAREITLKGKRVDGRKVDER